MRRKNEERTICASAKVVSDPRASLDLKPRDGTRSLLAVHKIVDAAVHTVSLAIPRHDARPPLVGRVRLLRLVGRPRLRLHQSGRRREDADGHPVHHQRRSAVPVGALGALPDRPRRGRLRPAARAVPGLVLAVFERVGPLRRLRLLPARRRRRRRRVAAAAVPAVARPRRRVGRPRGAGVQPVLHREDAAAGDVDRRGARRRPAARERRERRRRRRAGGDRARRRPRRALPRARRLRRA